MSNLKNKEKRILEKAFGMHKGYVLNFSNRTFTDYMFDNVDIKIYDDKYAHMGDSKANRLRSFWELEPNYIVGKLLKDIAVEYNSLKDSSCDESLLPEVQKIAQRLIQSAPIPDIESIKANIDDKDFETLAKSVREYINNNEPQVGLDRLHTFVVKYVQTLCEKHGIDANSDKPLHSIFGEYVKKIKNDGLIESSMTEKILKSSLAAIESFNHVRNKQSYAHNNPILNHNESLLIFGYVTSMIRFIEALESNNDAAKQKNESSFPF